MRTIGVIGVPLDFGASRRGADQGPRVFREIGITQRMRDVGNLIFDAGDIFVPSHDLVERGEEKCKYRNAIESVCSALARCVSDLCLQETIPLILGGDHSFSMGSVAGVVQAYRQFNKNIGLLWIDAHADINTPSSTMTGNMHGMPLSFILGLADTNESAFVNPRITCIIGARDIEKEEWKIIQEAGVHVFSMDDIVRLGSDVVMERSLNYVAHGTGGVHVSFDIDVLDPLIAPGTGTPVSGGLTSEHVSSMIKMIVDSGLLASLDIAELNPLLDHKNITAECVLQILLSAFEGALTGSSLAKNPAFR